MHESLHYYSNRLLQDVMNVIFKAAVLAMNVLNVRHISTRCNVAQDLGNQQLHKVCLTRYSTPHGRYQHVSVLPGGPGA